MTGQRNPVRGNRAEVQPLLEKVVRALCDHVDDERLRVYPFRSQARGDESERSDYDLLVVVPRADEPEYRLSQRVHSLICGMGISADILVWTRIKASLPATVIRIGRLLYAA